MVAGSGASVGVEASVASARADQIEFSCVRRYNLENSPHLRPAFVLDEALQQFSRQLQAGVGAEGLSPAPEVVRTDADVEIVMDKFHHDWIPRLRLWEFFVIDRERTAEAFRIALTQLPPAAATDAQHPSLQQVIASVQPTWTRGGMTVDVELAARHFSGAIPSYYGEETPGYHQRLVDAFKGWIDAENAPR